MPNVELRPILDRLRTRFVEGNLYQRTERVIQLVENFDKRYLNASLLAKNQSPIAKYFHLL